MRVICPASINSLFIKAVHFVFEISYFYCSLLRLLLCLKVKAACQPTQKPLKPLAPSLWGWLFLLGSGGESFDEGSCRCLCTSEPRLAAAIYDWQNIVGGYFDINA